MTIHITDSEGEYLCKEAWINYVNIRLSQPEHIKQDEIDSHTPMNDVCIYCKKQYQLENQSQVSDASQ